MYRAKSPARQLVAHSGHNGTDHPDEGLWSVDPL